MRFNEALYFAFVIGHRGTVYRNAWKNSTDNSIRWCTIENDCNPFDEDDSSQYLNVERKPFSYVRITEDLKNKIQMAIRDRRFANNKYGLDISDEDLKAEDWIVDNLHHIGTRF